MSTVVAADARAIQRQAIPERPVVWRPSSSTTSAGLARAPAVARVVSTHLLMEVPPGASEGLVVGTVGLVTAPGRRRRTTGRR